MGATLEATRRYADRVNGYFHEEQGLMMSSIGIGTYLGEADDETDGNYRRAIVRAVELGVNVIDTAINYRFQRSERAIADAIRELESSNKARRDELIIATKAGYLAFDGCYPPDPREYFVNTFVTSGVIGPRDIVAGSHCMAPKYLEHQIEQSLRNLRIHTIDIFYVHNPETQLSEIDRSEFHKRLRVTFGFLEGAVQAGKIRMYGTATWNGYRVAPDAADFISIEDITQCARDVAGDDHHFRVVQLPYNLAMPDAFMRTNQKLGDKVVSTLDACRGLGLTVVASASIFQSRLARNLPPDVEGYFPGLQTDAQRAIQFVRSTPGIAVGLVGMSSLRHVEENLAVAQKPPESGVIRKMFDAA